MLRSTGPPRHSRVCSSTMDTILIGRPSVVASNWKSTAHTTFGASAVGGFGVFEAPRRLRRRRCRRQAPKPVSASRSSTWPGLNKSAILAAERTSSSASRAR
jgi:hypothetical protein